MSYTINEEPSLAPFPGWIALLQSDKSPSSRSQVDLTISKDSDRVENHPELSYVVAACGQRPFRGVLILGGAARLRLPKNHATIRGPDGASAAAVDIRDLQLFSVSSGSKVNLGHVQLYRLAIPAVRCATRFAPTLANPPFYGAALIATGYAGGPAAHDVPRPWWQRWNGLRSSETWPLLGTFPGVSLNDLGDFEGVTGLTGTWVRPAQEYLRVTGGSLLNEASVDFARPALSSSSGELTWESTSPFAAFDRVSDTDAVAAWQQGLIFATIWMAIAGSLAAALVLEVRSPGARRPRFRLPTRRTKLQQSHHLNSYRDHNHERG